ncbi:MAG: dihydropteroate synthase [Pseudomonadota bacterium]
MRERVYVRPIIDEGQSAGARRLAGRSLWFSRVEILRRQGDPEVLPVDVAEALYGIDQIAEITRKRGSFAGLEMTRTQIMAVINVTPDSFSDGGRFAGVGAAVDEGLALVEKGADLLDIGGESTRPGADPVCETDEADRVLPVIEGLISAGCKAPISIDTRKASVAREAVSAGAVLFNDVSALTYDPESIRVAAPAYCLMHALGDPRTMQNDPRYDHVLLDVYDFLEQRAAAAEAAGIPRDRILVDPGIGFGKTLEHNLTLMRGLGLFHGLGCPILLGASRKRFIGTISGEPVADRRAPGSVAAALWGAGQGVQMIRVHDVAETSQALRVWEALQEDRV